MILDCIWACICFEETSPSSTLSPRAICAICAISAFSVSVLDLSESEKLRKVHVSTLLRHGVRDWQSHALDASWQDLDVGEKSILLRIQKKAWYKKCHGVKWQVSKCPCGFFMIFLDKFRGLWSLELFWPFCHCHCDGFESFRRWWPRKERRQGEWTWLWKLTHWHYKVL